MRTEQEIRQAIRTMVRGYNEPCSCEGSPHEQDCEEGGLMMAACIDALSWAVGDSDGFGRLLREIRRELVRRQGPHH